MKKSLLACLALAAACSMGLAFAAGPPTADVNPVSLRSATAVQAHDAVAPAAVALEARAQAPIALPAVHGGGSAGSPHMWRTFPGVRVAPWHTWTQVQADPPSPYPRT